MLQRTSAGSAAMEGAPPIVDRALRSTGQPLDSATRAFMEPRFGYDFSRVRVHSDTTAAESAQAVNAAAYTVGRDVVFGVGQYMPTTSTGQRLLAHELTHVMQQLNAAVGSRQRLKIATGGGSANELEAERTSSVPVSDSSASEVTHLSANVECMAMLQRQVAGSDIALDTGKPTIIAEIPLIFEGDLIDPAVGGEEALTAPVPSQQSGGIPGSPFTSAGLAGHVLASGELDWLSSGDAARRVLSRQYWSPFVPSRGTITLDRLLKELPRDLAPKIEGEIAAGGPLSWIRQGFTEAELNSIPNLVRRLNTGGLESLTPQELNILLRSADIHVGGPTPGSPFASFTKPRGPADLGFLADSRYRVRVEVPRSSVLDVSELNPFTREAVRRGSPHLPNPQEAEFLVTANHRGRIVSVQLLSGSDKIRTEPRFLLRHAGKIRWGGRALFVAGLALSAYRIAKASPKERPVVAGEEAGGLASGALGTAGAVTGCIALAVPTSGLSLFICGLAGGFAGSVIGSSIGGFAAGGELVLQEGGGTLCPSCHAMQREWEAKRTFRTFSSLERADPDLPGSLLSTETGTSGRERLSKEETDMIRRWVEESSK